MVQKNITVTVLRTDPEKSDAGTKQRYTVPFTEGMSAMDVLDYIYQHLDSSVAYYDHAGCGLGICARCTGRINGKAGLFCQTPVDGGGELVLEPTGKDRVQRDLVMKKK
ncbi:MAG: succinate dehydrogenase [Deltaproteobacteria bacterium]|nr:succinate dehydrogenase [Candidatus Zymogenaceae bacterium]